MKSVDKVTKFTYAWQYLVELILEPIAWILSFVLPYFAKERLDWCDNGAEKRIEPRLPLWLSWFQTPDNSLYGDYGWKHIHCKENWQNRKGFGGWLRRNRLHGLSWNKFSVIIDRPVTYEGDLNVDRNGHFGTLKCRCGNAWEWKHLFKMPFFNYAILLHFGWLMHPYITSPLPWYEGRAKFLGSIKIGSLD